MIGLSKIMVKYNPQKIEKKWQKKWYNSAMFEAKNNSKKEKFYLLLEFPYPSGVGLHVGHCRPYIGLDVIARKRRMQGQNVLFPMGWDAFGLPTENFAIKMGVQPAIVTKKNSGNFKKQMKNLGLSFDWSREINTTDPAYYKWTQWIFIQLFKNGLAYKSKIEINWCPKDKIGLANEEVVGGKCERCGTVVEKREKEQWLIKITKYADRLIKDLDLVDYPERVKQQQKNWIGKSEGAEITFPITDRQNPIVVFTTRPDTIFGCTFLVLAPEHPAVNAYKDEIKNWEEVNKYVAEARNKSDLQRQENKEKTGIELKGVKAINPANQKEIPVFIADYVMTGYGTGAIMAVPAHDQRDFEFAKKYDLPIVRVIANNLIAKSIVWGRDITKEALEAIGVKVIEEVKTKNEEYEEIIKKVQFPISSAVAFEKIIVEKLPPGFWNEYVGPNGIIFHFKNKDSKVVRHVLSSDNWKEIDRMCYEFFSNKKADADWKARNIWQWLADAENSFYKDLIVHSDQGILENSGKFDGMDSQKAKWEITKFVSGKKMVQYKLRDWVFSRQHYWGEPIPMIYCGRCGWQTVLEKDLPLELPKVKKYQPTDTGESPLSAMTAWVNTKCPECKGPAKRETDTMPNWAGSNWYFLRYTDPKNNKKLADEKALKYWMPVDWYNGGMEHTTLHLLYSRFIFKFLWDIGAVPKNIGSEPYKKRTSHGLVLAEGGAKMSKSVGNVINPDDVASQHGADTLRVYEMFMGPFEQTIPWDSKGIVGARRFLEKIYTLASKKEFSKKSNMELSSLLNKTIKKVSEDIEQMKFNTAISSLMILVNSFYEKPQAVTKNDIKNLLVIVSPFAPHLCEELWERLGFFSMASLQTWPTYNAKLIKEGKIILVVQVNGRFRDKIEVSSDADQRTAEELVMQSEKIKNWVGQNKVKKIIFVPNKLINIVI